ncbi:hypothetical protein FA375_07305 [Pseudomonas aeruginosa]|nr:hypothetical protein [Pseudomonas aeruginosa]MBK3761633.1 hypothetical protein [Pseudomonas aeruginosa]MBK3767655.1 hypothetical protein [Pseudomonas aeruginosa]MBK3788361.1 hypothetical protein [Pseudomonas aeruginosa]MBK3884407.1 hypothetical protein [Pseudomonas aeruginosa]
MAETSHFSRKSSAGLMFFLAAGLPLGGGGQGGVPALCENSMRPRVASEQKVIGFEPNQRYVAN